MLAALSARCEDGPVHAWELRADRIEGRTVKPVAGTQSATIIGPVKYEDGEPRALLLPGDSEARQCIEVSDDLAKANLPARSISAEAVVWIDTPLEWGGIVGALQDNGNYEKGWLLGYCHSQFSFAVASKGAGKLTYLKARTVFAPGCWYHVAGTYDGREMRLYVDGRLESVSREQSSDIDYPPRGVYTIGAYRDENELHSMAGRIARVAVFDRALSAAEVAARFADEQKRIPGIAPVRPVVADWPTYMRDNQRTGQADAELKLPLRHRWETGFGAPRPAWPEEAKNDYFNNRMNLPERVTYDRAFHVVGVGDRICFASSANDTVRCLDAATGDEVWAFQTEGPVRTAPAIAGERVFFSSDDGSVYCVALKDGALQWKREIAPSPRRIAGNERIISAWPVRTDVFVEGETGYACAGVFASQGVYLTTLDLRDGRVLEQKKLPVTAQGYPANCAGQLYVPTGRDPAGAFVAKLKTQGKTVGAEVSPVAKQYPFAWIGAGSVRVAGGDGKVAAFGADGKELWSAEVKGRAYSLAVVNGRLFASTDEGIIYCFAAGDGDAQPRVAATPAKVEPAYPDAKLKERYAAEAERIVAAAKTARGYCLVLGSGDGWLVYELAKRTGWHIIGREADATKAARARKMLNDAGFAGRAAIHHGPLDKLPYSDCLFNVVACDEFAGARDEALRVVRPDGGVAILGREEKDIVRRGPLDGIGEWTHMYANPANTACSGERRISGDKTYLMQWFGPPGPRTMIDRHHRTVAPLYKHGRLFVPGEDRVAAVDAYNGTNLWEIEIPNSRRVVAFRDASYMALADDALYVATTDTCLAFDPASGKQTRALAVPADDRRREWGYLAVVGDTLLGSAVRPESSRRQQSRLMSTTETHFDFVPVVCSDELFALKRADGSPLWRYRAQTGAIANSTIAVGGGAIFFLESANPETLKTPTGRMKLQQVVERGSHLTALDLQTGAVKWRVPGERFAMLQHNVFAVFADGLLVVSGSRNSGTHKKADRVIYEIAVFDAASGAQKWSHTQTQPDAIGGDHGEQERHPVIVDGRVYCEPYAYDLTTGAMAEWKWPWMAKRRRGCGSLSASATCLFFRNEHPALFDLKTQQFRDLTSETRLGCWINLLPVGGMLLAPEASSGCTCPYAIQTSFGLIPAP
jgi:outer membrane protein assembly factor BamB